MINAQNYAKGTNRESRTVYGQCFRIVQRVETELEKAEQIIINAQNYTRAELEKADKVMVNALCKGQRQGTQNRLWSMHYAKGRDRERRTDYGQRTMQRAETENAGQVMVNALCKRQRQRTQDRLWSMHYTKGRDRERRTGCGQCTTQRADRERRTCYGQCTMQKAETENAEQVMVNTLCKGQRQRKQDSL